ncbi:MAG: undecaprenyl-diphosphatase [Gaiellaceae bacterium]|nr:undecaprenyl-diphosphatase [Gaiellaceae bacterium]MDX6478696.1 undecaprenyl-diphosphatase [Gaiellaceae bacterium]
MLLGSLDGQIAVWVTTHRVSSLNWIFIGLGRIEMLGAVWIALAFALGLATRRGILASLGLAILAGSTTFAADAASFGLKDLTSRTRPFVAHPEIHPLYVVHSSSFPAGHAATAFAGATLLAYVWRRGTAFFLLLASAIGYSRVYVGVHYPSDVLVGALLGVVVGLIGVAVLAWLRRRRERHD